MFVQVNEGPPPTADFDESFEPASYDWYGDLEGLGKFRIKKPKFLKKIVRPLTKVLLPPKPLRKIVSKIVVPPKPLMKVVSRLPGGKVIARGGGLVQQVISEPTMVLRPKAFAREVEQVVAVAPLGKQLLKMKQVEKRLHTQTGKFVRKNMGTIGTVVSVVGTVFPILKPIGMALQAGAAARKVAQGRKEQKRAQEDEERIQRESVQQLVDEGIPPDQAQAIVQRVSSGEDLESAMYAVLGDQPVQLTKPVAKLSPEAAQAEFLTWVANWRPREHAKAVSMMPALLQPISAEAPALEGLASGRIDDESGEWAFGLGEIDWGAAIGSFVETAGKVYGTVLQNKFDKKSMQIQLDRMKAGLPPAPTQQVEQQSHSIVQPSAPAPAAGPFAALGGGMMPVALLALGGGALFLMTQRRGRR